MPKTTSYKGPIGSINGVDFYEQIYFNAVEYLLNQIEERFGECYNDKFTKDLAHVIDTVYLKYDSISIGDIESEFYDSIKSADGFDDLSFTIDGDDWKFTWFNENLENGVYHKTSNTSSIYAVTSVLANEHVLSFYKTPQEAIQAIINDFLANNRIVNGLEELGVDKPSLTEIEDALKDNVEYELETEDGYDFGFKVSGDSFDDSDLKADVWDFAGDYQDSWALHTVKNPFDDQ